MPGESRAGRGLALETSRWLPWLLLIMLIGWALRVYRLEEQSLWWDDFNGLAHLSLDGFRASMLDARRMNPEGAPLYHVMQNLASLFIGNDEFAHRMLNTLLSTLTIPAIFMIGRLAFGPQAGLVAALLFALSPPHIFHAQSLRIYPLAMFIAALSLIAMERLLTCRSRRWADANAVLNGALCMTHLFGVFAVLAQGTAAAALLARGERPLLKRWLLVQALCLVPAGLRVLTMPARSSRDFWHFSMPEPMALLKDLIGDDLTDFAVNRAPSPAAYAGIPLDSHIIGTAVATTMMAFFAAVTLWAVARAVRGILTNRAPNANTPPSDFPVHALLMLGYWLLPVVYLLVLSLLWQPVMYPRYTLYACMGLYVLAGGFLQALPSPRLGRALLAALVAVYAHQLLLLLPSDTRTQWRQVARDVAMQVRPGDTILVGSYDWPDVSHRTFQYHYDPALDTPITQVYSTLDLLEQLRCHFLTHGTNPPAAWYVLNSHYYQVQPPVTEAFFRENGIQYSMTSYPAEEYIALFRILDWQGLTPDSPIRIPQPDAIPTHASHDHSSMLEELGLAHDNELHALLDRAFESGMPRVGPPPYERYLLALLDFHQLEAAKRFLDHIEAATGQAYPEHRWQIQLAAGELEQATQTLLALPTEVLGSPPFRIRLELTLWAAGQRQAAVESYQRHRGNRSINEFQALPLLDDLFLNGGSFAQKASQRRTMLYPHDENRVERPLYQVSGLERWISACTPPWERETLLVSTVEEIQAVLPALPD